MRLDAEVKELKGAGPKAVEALMKKEIRTIGDLLRFYPSGYDHFTPEITAAEAEPGECCSLKLTLISGGSTFRRAGKVISHFEGTDGTARVRLTFFNMPYVRQTLTAGKSFVFRGVLRETSAKTRVMEQPWFIESRRYGEVRGTFQPRYPSVKGIGPARMRSFLMQALKETASIKEDLPAEYMEKYQLVSRHRALQWIHFPEGRESLLEARRRLIFDEFFSFIIGVRRQKTEEAGRIDPRPMKGEGDWCGRLKSALPFSLTPEQEEVWREIRGDLTGGHLMNRLLQGDVGSGKTVLAFLALILCAENGRQGALMAPTEVLARQHMDTLTAYLEKSGLPVRPVLLTGSVKGKARRQTLEEIAGGTADVVIGTHALFQEAVSFRDLGLVITDEQHRFGVRQRTGLTDKGSDVPVLVMSATPIPRTLAIILYGELQVSSLRTLPPERKPVKSLALQDTQRGRAYRFILSQIAAGRQCYVICPAVEEGEMQEIENVRDYTEKLRASLPDTIRILSMTGRMKAADKALVMDTFSAHEADILVSTTVIEVGINVPNATVILIENAERFGLSQLHQLRGRVGRGADQSYCIFLYTGKEKPDRLSVLEENSSGFSIAEQDLKARGPGDVFGTRQSGMPQFDLADIYEDSDLLKAASACADEILLNNPEFRLSEERRIDFGTI